MIEIYKLIKTLKAFPIRIISIFKVPQSPCFFSKNDYFINRLAVQSEHRKGYHLDGRV